MNKPPSHGDIVTLSDIRRERELSEEAHEAIDWFEALPRPIGIAAQEANDLVFRVTDKAFQREPGTTMWRLAQKGLESAIEAVKRGSIEGGGTPPSGEKR